MGEKIAQKLYQWLEQLPHKPDWLLYNGNVREDILALEPTADVTRRQRQYVIEKLSLCCLIMAAGVFLSLVVWIKGNQDTQIVDNRLYREDYDGSSQSLKLTADNGETKAQFDLELMPRELSEQEMNRLYEEFIPRLEEQILGLNETLDRIEYDMNLITSMDGYPFQVEWTVPDQYMDMKGKLLQEEMVQPVVEELGARISYGSFVMNYTLACCIYQRAEPFTLKEKIAAQLLSLEEEDRKKEYITLPTDYGDTELKWSGTKNHTGLLILFLTPVLTVMIYMMKDKDLHKEVERRGEQMQEDYADIVSKISLLISAGMTVQGAWGRVAGDYRREREQTGRKRYAYEEMLLVIHGIENGTSARNALEQFGRRCRLPGYTRLAALLAQNLSKGSANLTSMLQAEAADAFEERKHTARKLGEKAGTKMLVPMMMLLGIVMVIITVPALTSY